jgi:hypothetical protein
LVWCSLSSEFWLCLWTTKDIIALTLLFFSRQWSSEGSGGGVANMNETGFALAVLVTMVGLAIVVVGTIRGRRGM